MFHAESAEVLDSINQNRPASPLLDFRFYSSFLYTRPTSAEDQAIKTVISLANSTGTTISFHLLTLHIKGFAAT